MSFLYEKTNAPDFWKETHYGKRDYCDNKIDNELVFNMNYFYTNFYPEIMNEENNLPRERYEKDIYPTYPDVSDMDHFQMYKLSGREGWIVIFSPYGGVRESAKEQIENYGYERYSKNLYNIDQEDHVCPTMYKLIL